MRRFLITTCLLAAIPLSGFGQAPDNTTKVKNFIKVWGLLKYYHPLVATGHIDWDAVFVNHFQKIIDAKNTNQFNSEIAAVINSVEKPSKVESHESGDSLFAMNKVNINWIIHSNIFDKPVKDRLAYIYDNKNQEANKYIKMAYETTDFSGEKKYDSIGFPGVQYRLLFLSRFWNIINYFAPYKYLTTNWDDVLQRFIPKIMASNDTVLYYKTLLELCKSLNDGHSQLTLSGQTSATDVIFGKYTVPFYCEIIAGEVVIRNVPGDSISKSLNIQQGDIVLKINGEDIRQVMNDRKNYIPASNHAGEMHELSKYILDGHIPAAKLDIQRAGRVIKTTITRISTATRNWGAFINYTSNDVGYRKLNDSVVLIYAMQIWNGNIDTIKHLIKQVLTR